MKIVRSGFRQYEGSNWVLVPEEELQRQQAVVEASREVCRTMAVTKRSYIPPMDYLRDALDALDKPQGAR